MSKYSLTALQLEELHVRARILPLALLVALTLAGLTPLTTSVVAPPPPGGPAAISLSTVPPKLPADNNTYPAVVVTVVDAKAQPVVALTNLTVFLTSSQENVGKVAASVEIAKGETYALANFTTTSNAGSTNVTATASGLRSTSTIVSTVVAVGYPTQLVITAVPSIVPARVNTGKLLLELEDKTGLPAKAVADTRVIMYSSNTNIVSVANQTTTITQGQYLEEMDYTSGFVPGSAVITASAPGFDSGVATVTVQGSPPLALKLFAQPTEMVTCTAAVTSCTGRLVVVLTDLSGNPARAANNTTVQIRSSNLAVVNTIETVTIENGSISATANYNATSNPGSTTMTASAPGLQSATTLITTVAPSFVSPSSCTSGTTDSCQLAIFAGPNPVLADHNSYSSVVVSLESAQGVPAINATGPTRVTLTSSITGVGDVNPVNFTILQGHNWQNVTFTSTYQVGTTQLTASGQNLLPAQIMLTTNGPVPSQVVLTPISGILPADGASHPALELSLEDAFGSPAPAPFDVPVSFSSSNNDVVNVADAIIPAGQTFAVVNVTAGILAGSANVTALESSFTSGYATSLAILKTIVPAPSALAAYLPDGGDLLPAANSTLPLLAIQLHDSTGNPARARAAMNVTITSSNSTVVGDVLTAPVAVGQDFTTIAIPVLVPGQTTLTFSTPGLSSASLSVTFLPDPLQITISGGPAAIMTGQTSVISVNVLVDGQPFQGATVQWSTTTGGFNLAPKAAPALSATSTQSTTGAAASQSTSKPAVASPASPSVNDTTDKNGASTAIYRPSNTGQATISAIVSDAGFFTKNLNFTVTTSAPPQVVKAKSSLTQEFMSFPLLLVPIGAVGGGGAAAFFLIRRRGKGGGTDEEFDNTLE